MSSRIIPAPLSHSRREVLQAVGATLVTPVTGWLGPVRPRLDDAAGDGWRSLFDGRDLGLWKPTEFGGQGDVVVTDGQIVLGQGGDLTGITWTGDVPTNQYEIALRAMRLVGGDFFCGLTFPVDASHCSLIVGGWAGTVVGLSSLDGMDASENETTTRHRFTNRQWYAVRVRVTSARIRAWIDDEAVVDVDTSGLRVSVRAELLDSRPLGVASWRTRAALKDIRLKPGVSV